MPPVVLCIDSRRSNLEAERRALEVGGYKVLTAATCEEAHDLLRRSRVDLILLSDDLSGGEYRHCARLRGLAGDARIILQRTFFGKDHGPAEADIVLAKTTEPREKQRILASLLLPQAA